MKKMLSLLLLSSPLFSMQLALKMQTPRFSRFKSAITSTYKPVISQVKNTVSDVINTPKTCIERGLIRSPHALADAQLYHGKKGFVVLHDGKNHAIEKHFMNRTARDITKEQLQSFLKIGYFYLHQTNDGAFKLNAYCRLPGGGPVFGKIMYWATKISCYAVLAAGAGAIVLAGGGVGVKVAQGEKGVQAVMMTAKQAAQVANHIAAPMSSTAAGFNGMAAAATGYFILESGTVVSTAHVLAIGSGTVAGISPMGMSGIIAGGIVSAGGAPVCAKAAGAALATGSSGTGIVAGIEALSVAVGLACGLAPTL